MTFSPLISVLMPAYNSELYIAEAIESILNQTYQNFELLIYDDGSSDNTRKIIDQYQDSRIIKYYSNHNAGVVVARNSLIDSARGKYIALMDSDDISGVFRLEKQFKFLEKNEIDLCGTSQWNFNQRTGKIKASKDSFSDADLRSLLAVYCSICNSTVMGKSAIFKEFKYSLEMPMAEDYFLWCQIAASGYKFANLKDRLLVYRQYPEQSSSKHASKFKISTLKIQKIYLALLGVPEKFRPKHMPLTMRIYRASSLLIYLNIKFPGMSISAANQIYTRFQNKRVRWIRLFQKLEKLLITTLIQLYFLLIWKKF
jgi:glycosyltransferase involved in cell wall biosynthesis